MAQGKRQAGAEIKVTPEMVEEGLKALHNTFDEVIPLNCRRAEEAVSDNFRAMLVSRQPKP